MSAVNIAVLPDRVIVVTDTKTTTGDGMQFNSMKIATLPFTRLAIAVRGKTPALHVFERTLAAYAPDYDRAVVFLAKHFETVLAAEYPDKSEHDAMNDEIDLFVAGWSKSGPAAFWISSYQNGRRIERIEGALAMPAVSAASSYRSVADMPQLVKEQAAVNPGVGGVMVCTEIGETGILSYPLGPIDELASVLNRAQPQEEKERLAAIRAENDRRAAVLAAGTEVG